jgi:hypothetical protein
MLTDQLSEIDVDRSPEAIPTRKSVPLLARNIREGIADILKIEFHTALLQARPFAAPVSEEMAVRALTRFVTVRAGGRLLWRSLAMGRKCKHTKTAPQQK